jgi:hypothetical protein
LRMSVRTISAWSLIGCRQGYTVGVNDLLMLRTFPALTAA